MSEKFTWPADLPRSERARHSKVIDPGGEHHGKPALVIATLGRRSLDGRFSWVLNSTYGPYGWSAPITHRHSETGKTVALSGLISRKGYVRIIREDIGAVAWDGLHTELKAAAIFERSVINPLLTRWGHRSRALKIWRGNTGSARSASARSLRGVGVGSNRNTNGRPPSRRQNRHEWCISELFNEATDRRDHIPA